MLLYNIAAEVFANLINADKRIKGIQIGGHKIKIENFIDNTTIFLRDITCVNSIQGILKLYEKDKLAQIIFSNFHFRQTHNETMKKQNRFKVY